MSPIDTKRVVVDARMINTSGIGRYISSLIPSLIDNYQHTIIIGKRESLSKKQWYKESLHIVDFKSEIYTIKEQFEFIIKIPTCDIFISPHYNIPLLSWKMKKQVTFFPDVNHLAIVETLSLFKRMYALLIYNLGSLKSDIIITISEFSKSEIIKLLYIKPGKIVIAKCGVDTQQLKELKSDNDDSFRNDLYILYVGNVKPHKNLYRALLAFEKVKKKVEGIKFCIVGRKEGFITGDEQIFNLLDRNKELREAVVFTGYVNDEELTKYYSKAMVLLFPSLYEGFGLPPLEAMSLGCPVITSNGSSMPEICGDAALYCDPYDIEDIALRLMEIYSNDLLRSELIKRGSKKVSEYSWNKFNSIVLGEIKEVLKK